MMKLDDRARCIRARKFGFDMGAREVGRHAFAPRLCGARVQHRHHERLLAGWDAPRRVLGCVHERGVDQHQERDDERPRRRASDPGFASRYQLVGANLWRRARAVKNIFEDPRPIRTLAPHAAIRYKIELSIPLRRGDS
jgi:hypothetical protein